MNPGSAQMERSVAEEEKKGKEEKTARKPRSPEEKLKLRRAMIGSALILVVSIVLYFTTPLWRIPATSITFSLALIPMLLSFMALATSATDYSA